MPTHISIHALREEGDFYERRLRHVLVTFLSTPSARRATLLRMPLGGLITYFYPRPPRGGRLGYQRPEVAHHQHFYPRPPRGGRQTRSHLPAGDRKFLSTPSARRATAADQGVCTHLEHFYPRPPRGGRPGPPAPPTTEENFYPRPPRGGRRVGLISPLYHVVISIHALREEGDCLAENRSLKETEFLSTPSARRAT